MSETADFLTVGTVGYTHQAVATLRSARRYGTYSSFYFFAVDATAEAVADLRRILAMEDPWIGVFGPYDLGPERTLFLNAFKYYNTIEMCCLAKYVGISHVFREPLAEDICVYADCDIFFLGDITDAIDEMGRRTALLTPHRFGPISDDVEHEHLIQGWINAGFFIFRRQHAGIDSILGWLVDRISRRGFFAPQFGLMCDQPWLSALPFLYSDLTCVSRHPALNVAYWNLDERCLTRVGETTLVNGAPLSFFHFSGFDRTSFTRLSKHSDLPVNPNSALEVVCRLYKSELDTAAALQPKLVALKTLPCSKGDLQERIYLGSVHNRLSISSPTAKLGLFSRIGRKVDFLLGRLMA